ncbi:MAG TPA: hypothetical protein DCR65_02335, partial [Gammaproteobacteria bacterium]|nr:hypothetical protein [Gammaproteobacteria bacterium]
KPGTAGTAGDPTATPGTSPEATAGTPSAGAGQPDDSRFPPPPKQRGGAGDDGWVTSNEIPGVGGNGEDPAQGGAEGAGAESAGVPGGEGTPGGEGAAGGEGELDAALEGLDGEIMAERGVIRSRANAGAGAMTIPGAGAGGSEGSTEAEGSSASGGTSAVGGVPTAKAGVPGMPPAGADGLPGGIPGPRSGTSGNPGSGPVPKDIPMASQDDDIIARQLREAAMKETDPELREKLWAEYRRYKGI